MSAPAEAAPGDEWSSTIDVLERLPELVQQARVERGLNFRQAAASMGLALSVVHNVEHGGDVRLSTVVTLLKWLRDD